MIGLAADDAATDKVLAFPNWMDLTLAAPCIGDQDPCDPARFAGPDVAPMTDRFRHRSG
jgi:hypothetical protein